uniref:Protein FAR1-RELATED SEQUENCE n=1 Tax=Leersia perrieri TaxID=77586 RepID=A0A0D9X1Q9_9ORYZ
MPLVECEEVGEVLAELRDRRNGDDPEGYHDHKAGDDGGRLEGIFWASADSRIDYLRHGDVVVFDTTFRTAGRWRGDGIPCRHILRVMSHRGVSRMPECLVLRRQRRFLDAKMERTDEMKDLSREVFDLVSEDAREFEEVKKFFEGFLKQRHAWLDAASQQELSDEGGSPATKKIKLSDD